MSSVDRSNFDYAVDGTCRGQSAREDHEAVVEEILRGLRRRREQALRLPSLGYRGPTGLAGRDPWLRGGAS